MLYQKIVGVTLLVVLGLSETFAIDLPASMQRCHVEDEECVIKQGYSLINFLKTGIPDLNLPSHDPIELGKVHALNDNAAGGALSFNLKLTNTTLHKLTNNTVIKSVKGFTKDLSKPLQITVDLFSPTLEVHAKYDVKGRIMILPIISKGDIIIFLNQVQTKSQVTALFEKHEDGHYYLKITEYKSDSKVGSGSLSISNLFKENLALHDSTMDILNCEWTALSADIQPKVLEAGDRAFKRLLQKLLDIVPYDVFFDNI